MAEQLPIRVFTTAEGLAHDHISRIRRDSRGFLWICTDEGLSRFDGHDFVTYGRNEGLPHPHVNDLLESRDGTLWIATDGGLSRFNPNALILRQPLFQVFVPGPGRSSFVNSLAEDRDGTLLCATSDGLFRFTWSHSGNKFDRIQLPTPTGPLDITQINSVIVDGVGTIWAGGVSGLYRRPISGRTLRYTKTEGLPHDLVNLIYTDGENGLWIGTRGGGVLKINNVDSAPPRLTGVLYSSSNGLPSNDVRALQQSRDGSIWVGSIAGLSKLSLDHSGGVRSLVTYSEAHGLTDPRVYSLLEDTQSNLWIGTNHGGVMRLAQGGLTTFGEKDGFAVANFHSVLDTRAGELCFWSGDNSARTLQCFEGRRFRTVQLPVPASVTRFGYLGPLLLQDREKALWFGTNQGLFRFPPFQRTEDLARLHAVPILSNGVPSQIFGLFEDSQGDLWMNWRRTRGSLRWERSTGHVYEYPGTTLLPGPHSGANAYQTDGAGSVWIGFYEAATLLRYGHGRFERIALPSSTPSGTTNAMYLDSRRRLWIASSQDGLYRTDHPEATKPKFIRLTRGDGLSSDEICCVTEDRFGRIYAATGRGLDRLDPAPGGHVRIKHYGLTDGVAKGSLLLAHRDCSGALWFVTNFGASRLIPEPGLPSGAPAILITRLRIEGVDKPLSQFGEKAAGPFRLSPAEKHLEIEFAGLDAGLDSALRYEYLLEGLDRNWHAAAQRMVSFGGLSPGAYEFRIRALNWYGTTSTSPATVRFEILPPLWRRWWMLVLAGAGAILLISLAHRYDVNRRLAVERVRTRIATDLHDDLGATLSQVAIMSEVVSRQAASHRQALDEIANAAREALQSTSEIVWAIDPAHDRLSDLTQRMRWFAGETLSASGVAHHFAASSGAEELRLGAATRREVFLIFKECINNIARHSSATRAQIRLSIEGSRLMLRIEDDGSGFDIEHSRQGHGLRNMAARASLLGGRLEAHSRPGQGACFILSLPLSPSRHDWRRTLHKYAGGQS